MRALLSECYELTKQIKELEEKILEIETVLYSPRNQIISDMPKGGGGTESTVDKLLYKLDQLKEKRKEIKQAHAEKWKEISKMLCCCTYDEKMLFKLRFYYGLEWKACSIVMSNETHRKWDENRIFRVYRSVCENYTKNHKEIC